MRVWPFALVFGLVFAYLVTRQPINDSDLFWHAETGRLTLAGDLPRVDVFSWTVRGTPVFTDQWLGDLILAAARAVAGWAGVLALRALAVFGLVTLIVDSALHARPGRPIVAIAAALPATLLSRFAWTDRPELLGLVCFALMIRLLRGGDRELLLAIPLLFVWAQLHGSYALGLGLILASCAARAIEEKPERWRFVPIASFAVLMALLGPSGLDAWTSSGGHFLAPPRFIAEEGAPDARTLPGALFLITLALVIATASLGRRATLREMAVLVPVALVSLTATRHTPLLAIAAVPFFASRWPDPIAALRDRPRAAPEANAGRTRAFLIALLAFLPIAVLDARVDESTYPRAALAAVPEGAGVFNQYDWGGWLIYAKPSTPVFIDGRLFPYVPDVLADYRAIVGAHPGWESVVARRGVKAMLVRPSDPIAVRATERGWRVAFQDAISVVLIR